MSGIRLNPSVRLGVLSDEQVDMIHEASMRILERTGMRFDSEDAITRLLKSGAIAHPTKKGVVTFPRSIVEESIGKVPRECVYYARDKKLDVRYDGEHMFPYAGGGDPKILDLRTGKARPSMYEDVEMAARLGDILENNHYASSMVMATDVPPQLIVPKTVEATMRNSTKPVTSYAPNKETVDCLVEMWACVAGGTEELRKRPLLSLGSSPSSPLTFGKHNCEVLIRSLEQGIPFSVIPCPICGETGPMTLSGSLAQQNAELLGGLVLMQTVDPDLPTIYSGRVCMMDPRTGRDLWGTPEEALVSAAIVQLARRYEMVSDTSGAASDITRWDLQMGIEQTLTSLVPALAGAESISGIGSGWEGASSLEMMVIGNEMFKDISRLLGGIGVDESSLGVGMIDRVGHMGSFLAERHTMDAIQRGEVRISDLWDKRGSERVKAEGHKTLQEMARDRAKELLDEAAPEPLDRDVERDIDDILKKAARTLPA